MTNEQKAIKIAKFDGRLDGETLYATNDPLIETLTEKYLTNLHYLIPCWVHAWQILDSNKTINLQDVLKGLTKQKGKYQYLFDDLYSIIVVIEDSPF